MQAAPAPGCAAALAYSAEHQGVALLVLEDGKVRCASDDVSTPQELWSGTKSLVGLMAAAGAEGGLLPVDEPSSATPAGRREAPKNAATTTR